MENHEILDSDNFSNGLLETDHVQGILTTTYKWAKFLAIIGFIFSGFILLASLGFLTGSNALSQIDQFPFNVVPVSVFGLMYLLTGVIYFVPSLYLYQYSEKLKAAISSKNEDLLILALNKNKAFFKFIGIMTLVGIALYLLLILAFAGTIAAGGMSMVTP